MRIPVAAANWKCHTRLESALALARDLREAIDGVEGVEKVVCPPFVYLAAEALAIRR
jgi:triosephosphate isomerase